MHIASALGVKVTGIYGPTETHRTGPFGSNFNLVQAKNCECIGGFFDTKKCKVTDSAKAYCMKNIEVDYVLEKISVLKDELVSKI